MLKIFRKPKLKVVVEVTGGVAWVTKCPENVIIEIIDHDNQEAEEELDDTEA